MSAAWVALALCCCAFVGCGGESVDCPLACTSTVEERPEGRRLVVQCTRDVSDPPPECQPLGDGAYSCNTLHTYAEFCETFPGAC
jgi:hypothetical protein